MSRAMLFPQPADKMAFAEWTYSMNRSVLRQMIEVASQPGILSFAGGLPAPELFPTRLYAQSVAQVLASDERALQYNPPLARLKSQIVKLMALRGVDCTTDQVFLTTGAQQGLDILTRMLLNPGGELMLEEVVYTGVQQAVAPLRPHVTIIPTDLQSGIDVDAIEALLLDGARPSFIYIIPDAHNPLGLNLSLDKRQRLVSLARRFAVPLIEDDPYGLLSYDGSFEPPLRALDGEWVFYLGSFSKILAPALRLGWMIAPRALLPKLTVIKEASDLESSGLTQRAVTAFLEGGYLPDHLDKLRLEYGRRLDAMLAALRCYFPAEAHWTQPTGGMFIWVVLPPEIDTAQLLQRAVDVERVAYIPGHAFAVSQTFNITGFSAGNCMRLNFSNSSPAHIDDGIKRLARVLHSV